MLLFSNVYVLCTNHIMFQQKVKGLFIRFSKLFDSTPPIKTHNKSLGCGWFSSWFFFSQGGRQRETESIDSWCCQYYWFMVLWIIKAGRNHLVWTPYFKNGEFSPKVEGCYHRPSWGSNPLPLLPWSKQDTHISVTVPFTHSFIHPSRNTYWEPHLCTALGTVWGYVSEWSRSSSHLLTNLH